MMESFIRKCSLAFGMVLLVNTVVFSQEMMSPGMKPEDQGAGKDSAPSQSDTGPSGSQGASSAKPMIVPIIDIKKLEGQKPAYSLELRNADITDLFRILAHDYKLNLLIDTDVSGVITASLSNVSLEEALDAIAESQGLMLEKKGNIIKIKPNLITKTFTLKHVEAKKLLGAATSSTGTDSSTGKSTSTTSGGAAAGGTSSGPSSYSASGTQAGSSASGAGAPASSSAASGSATETGSSTGTSTSTQANTLYDLLSEKGKVLLGEQPNSIMVIDNPKNVQKIEDYIKMVDYNMTMRVFKLKYLKAADIVGKTTGSSSNQSATGAAATASGTSSGAGETSGSSSGGS